MKEARVNRNTGSMIIPKGLGIQGRERFVSFELNPFGPILYLPPGAELLYVSKAMAQNSISAPASEATSREYRSPLNSFNDIQLTPNRGVMLYQLKGVTVTVHSVGQGGLLVVPKSCPTTPPFSELLPEDRAWIKPPGVDLSALNRSYRVWRDKRAAMPSEHDEALPQGATVFDKEVRTHVLEDIARQRQRMKSR